MCSSFKLSLAAATLARADQEEEKLDRLVRYDKSVPFGVSPATAKNFDRGMTVVDLCAAAIIYSDNGAANLLLAAMGGPAVLTAFWRGIDDQSTRLDDIEPKLNIPDGERNTTTPVAMMADLKTYLLGDGLSAESRARLLGWMRGNTTGAARLRAGVPPIGRWETRRAPVPRPMAWSAISASSCRREASPSSPPSIVSAAATR